MHLQLKYPPRLTALLWLLMVLLMVASCQSSPSELPSTTEPISEATPVQTAVSENSYPAPVNTVSTTNSGYPAPVATTPVETSAAYPAPPQIDTSLQDPRFAITAPVSASDTAVTGQALPGLELAIVDITYNGVILGTGLSDENGRFSIPVSSLIPGNRIGITLFKLRPGESTIEDAVVTLYSHRGEGYMNLPNVGIFFDTLLVSP